MIVFTKQEVEELLFRLAEEVGADLLTLARGLVPKLNETPLPADDEQMFADRKAAIDRLTPLVAADLAGADEITKG